VYQTPPHQAVCESYNTVMLEIEAFGELTDGEFFPPRGLA
jgi:hypothetical protein